MNIPGIDTNSKYFKVAVVWAIFGTIAFIVLLFLNSYLDTNPWALAFIAFGTTGFLTSWLFRNTYSD